VALAGNARVGIGEGGDDPRDVCDVLGFGAGRGVAVVGSGLQRDVGGGAFVEGTCLFQGADFGVGAAAGLGPAATDDDPVLDDDAADSRVGPDIAQAPRGEAQGVGHVIGVAHSSAALPGRSSLTKPSKSSAVWKFL
jgi:hypothetical protein